MHVESVALEDFRNYERVAVELVPGVNLVVGRNAQGKTNLLEAVCAVGGLGSPRSPDSAMVRIETERALVHAVVNRRRRPVRIDLEIRRSGGSRALVNGARVAGLATLIELAPSVFFGPDDLLVVKGPPEGRRRMIDHIAVKLRPARADNRRELDRVLRQRNALLRSAGGRPGPTLDVWDEAFARVGARVVSARLETIALLAPVGAKHYEAIAGGGRLDLSYESAWLPPDLVVAAMARDDVGDEAFAAALSEEMARLRSKELERGISLVGPQRDDLAVALTGAGAALDARSFASQGDQRTAALALKLAERDLVADVLGEDPILLLDDVLSELDPDRRRWLVAAVEGSGQTIISSADENAPDLPGATRIIEVRDGDARVR